MLSGLLPQAPKPPKMGSNAHRTTKVWRTRFGCLTQIPQAARTGNFSERLRELGLDVSSEPTLLEIVAAFTRAVDSHIRERGKRTDLAEMAQLAGSETLASLVGRELPSLFGPTATDVRLAVAKLGISDRFSILARDFFSRLTSRSLGYFLSRELSKHVGPNKRFAAVREHSDFNAALDLHCREASRIIKEFSGGWYGKTLQQEKAITQDDARGFAHVAFKKLRAELRQAERRRCLSVSFYAVEQCVLETIRRCGLPSTAARRTSRSNSKTSVAGWSKSLPDLLIDLIEIAAYVYCADQATSRGGEALAAMGSDWRRRFRFVIPVRHPDHWSNPKVLEPLGDALSFLSDDDYTFEFEKATNPVPPGNYLELSDESGRIQSR